MNATEQELTDADAFGALCTMVAGLIFLSGVVSAFFF